MAKKKKRVEPDGFADLAIIALGQRQYAEAAKVGKNIKDPERRDALFEICIPSIPRKQALEYVALIQDRNARRRVRRKMDRR